MLLNPVSNQWYWFDILNISNQWYWKLSYHKSSYRLRPQTVASGASPNHIELLILKISNLLTESSLQVSNSKLNQLKLHLWDVLSFWVTIVWPLKGIHLNQEASASQCNVPVTGFSCNFAWLLYNFISIRHSLPKWKGKIMPEFVVWLLGNIKWSPLMHALHGILIITYKSPSCLVIFTR